jgi:hypothetical protein
VRIAHLILAHHQPRHLGRLVEQLADGNATFLIHVDRKSDIAPFRAAVASPRAAFMPERLSINWGGWNMVQATLNMLRRAHTERAGDYYQLLSDSCYPVKSNRDIAAKLAAAPRNYLTINHELTPQSPFFKRVGIYYWPDLLPARRFRRVHKLSSRLQRRLPARRLPPGLRLYKGWQWWCLSDACVEYILRYIDCHPETVRFFRHTSIPDETFFHSILANSAFAGTLSPGFAEGTISGNHYVRWHRGKSCVLKPDAFQALVDSDACFARKFDETSSRELVEMLRESCRADRVC